MPSQHGVFESARSLVSWAEENLAELIEIERVLSASTPRLVVDEDKKSGVRTFKLVLDAFSADRTARLVHEAVLHARHALDQAMFAAWAMLDNGEEAPHTLYFPITKDENQLISKLNSQKDALGKFGPNLKLLIKTVEPYPMDTLGGKGHPHLVALSEAARTKHKVVAKLRVRINRATFANWKFVGCGPISGVWSDPDHGVVLTRCGPEGRVSVGYVAFDKVELEAQGLGILDDGPVIENLRDIIDEIRRILNEIECAAVLDAK